MTPEQIERISDTLVECMSGPLEAFAKRLEKMEAANDTGPLLDLIARLEAQVQALSEAISAQGGPSR
jgi:hypothetical protein